MFIDYYKLLNISYTASDQEIKMAYNKKLHSNNTDSLNMTDNLIFEELDVAYQTLCDPKKRFKYNSSLIKQYHRKRSGKFKKIIQRLFIHDSY